MIGAEFQEAKTIVDRIAVLLMAAMRPANGRDAALARSAVSSTIANTRELLDNEEFAASLFSNFNLVRSAGGTLAGFMALRLEIILQAPVYLAGQFVVKMALLASLAQEARLIAATIFTSRYDVDLMSAKVSLAYEHVEEIFATWADPNVYLALLRMHSDLVKHLSEVARPLPRMVNYSYSIPYPSLTMANLVYADGNRAEELVAENKIVHPAFMSLTGQMLAN